MAEFFSDVTVESRGMETLDTEMTVTHDSPPPERSEIESLLIANVPVPTIATTAATTGLGSGHDVDDTTVSAPVLITPKTDSKQQSPRKNSEKKWRRSFTTEFKLECVEHAEKSRNKTETARLFNVNRRRVQEWCMQKEKLIGIPKQQKRISGGGRRQTYLDTLPGVTDVSNSDNTTNNILGDSGPTDTIQMLEPPSEISSEKATADISQGQAIDAVTPDTIMDNILRGLSGVDPSAMPLNMIKIIQELSSEVASLDSRVSVESTIRDTLMETLLQKSVDDTTLSPYLTVDESSDKQKLDQASSTDPVSQSVVALGTSIQQEPIAEEPFPSQSSAHEEPFPNQSSAQGQEDFDSALDADVSRNTGTEMVSSITSNIAVDSTAMAQSPMDTAVQATILDALMQVVSSVQEASTDVLHSVQASMCANPQPLTSMMDPPEDITMQDTAVEMEVNPMTLEEHTVVAANSLSSPSMRLDNTDQQPLNPNETLLLEESAAMSHADALSSTTKSSVSYSRSKVKKKYTVQFKLECVAYAESTSKCAAARHFNVDRRRVQDWCSQKEKLQQLKHVPVEDQKQVDADIEKRLAAWVKEEQEMGRSVTRRMVGEEAVRLYRESGNAGFSASIGWVAKFMIRNSISLVSTGRSQQQQQQQQQQESADVETKESTLSGNN